MGNFSYDNGFVHIGDDIAGTEYDVAHVKWGGSWRMPTKEQQDELIDNCTIEVTQLNGVNGLLVIGPNGNSIFLPASGERWGSDLKYIGRDGSYWLSTLLQGYEDGAYFLGITSPDGWSTFSVDYRENGLSVRAVIPPKKPQADFGCPDDHHPHMIDLGLSSGTKWSCCNVDATNPVEKGNYYAWGETETKDRFSWFTYIHCDGTEETCHDIGGDISGTEYDVAHVKWGPDWQMPTYDQFSELLSSCNFEETSMNGIKGAKIVGPNGICIFMPATDNYAFDGSYWSATNNYTRNSFFMTLWGLFGDFDPHMVSYPRCEGCCVRPVAAPQKQCPVAEAIDLGLPSGTKWASWNVGASAPEEAGGYYAWGETEEKDVYDWSTYTHCDGSISTCHHIGDDISGTEYDVAHVKWGGSWRMPSIDQIKELVDNGSWTWTTQNGVNGQLVTGPNGGTIFLPAAGERFGDYPVDEGLSGYYWSSSLRPGNERNAYRLYFSLNTGTWDYHHRGDGVSVRAVCP